MTYAEVRRLLGLRQILSNRALARRYRNNAARNENVSLFMASIGNPAPYEKTLHSAGHIVLDALAEKMEAELVTTPELKEIKIEYTKASWRELGVALSFWKSKSFMNTSGVKLAKTFKDWLWHENQRISVSVPGSKVSDEWARRANQKGKEEFKDSFRSKEFVPESQDTPSLLQLILLHDELEQPLGKLSVRYGGLEMSARGHNGVKSVVTKLADYRLLNQNSTPKTIKFPFLMRIGIGVGRPAERTQEAVSEHLLSQISDETYNKLRGLAPELLTLLQGELKRMGIAKSKKEVRKMDANLKLEDQLLERDRRKSRRRLPVYFKPRNRN